MTKKKLAIGALAVAIGLLGAWVWAKSWFAMGNRTVVDSDTAVVKTEKPQVIEFFIYNCPHCYSFEPSLKRWLEQNSDKVNFVRVPLALTIDWLPVKAFAKVRTYAKAYYALEEMGLIGKLHEKIFDAIHIQKMDLGNEESISDFLSTLGVDKKVFKERFNSDSVSKKVSEARKYAAEYYVRATPTVVVNKHFLASIKTSNNNNVELLQKVDDFVKQSRTE